MKIHLCADHLKQVADASGPGEVEKTAVWTDGAALCSICGSTPTTALGCVLVAADGSEVIDEAVPTLALTASRFAALASEAAKEKAS